MALTCIKVSTSTQIDLQCKVRPAEIQMGAGGVDVTRGCVHGQWLLRLNEQFLLIRTQRHRQMRQGQLICESTTSKIKPYETVPIRTILEPF